jgi:hypothetical protein
MTVAGQAGPKSAEAIIVDDAGTIVAQRTLTDRSAKVCLPLARAVGAWASLVLDAELARAKDDDGSEPIQSTTSGSGVGPATTLASDGRPTNDAVSLESEAPAAPRRSIELGMMTYLRNGLTGTGAFGGVSPYITVEVAPRWVVRSALMFGRSTTSVSDDSDAPKMSQVGGRSDFCRRAPGNYTERRGIEADMCLGLEGGVVTTDRSLPNQSGTALRLGVGPSANLRGELGAGIALEVRGLVGANLVKEPVVAEAAAPLVFAAVELGLSVRLP